MIRSLIEPIYCNLQVVRRTLCKQQLSYHFWLQRQTRNLRRESWGQSRSSRCFLDGYPVYRAANTSLSFGRQQDPARQQKLSTRRGPGCSSRFRQTPRFQLRIRKSTTVFQQLCRSSKRCTSWSLQAFDWDNSAYLHPRRKLPEYLLRNQFEVFRQWKLTETSSILKETWRSFLCCHNVH